MSMKEEETRLLNEEELIAIKNSIRTLAEYLLELEITGQVSTDKKLKLKAILRVV